MGRGGRGGGAHTQVLDGMVGLETILERPVEVVAETGVLAQLPGRALQHYTALLLAGNCRGLALCTDLLNPSRRTCHWFSMKGFRV